MTCVTAIAACKPKGARPSSMRRLQIFGSIARLRACSLKGADERDETKYQRTMTAVTAWPMMVALADPATPQPKTRTKR